MHPTSLPRLRMVCAVDTDPIQATQPSLAALGSYESLPLEEGVLTERGLLYVLAEGMGGVGGAQEASRLALWTMLESYYSAPKPLAAGLETAIQAANARIYGRARQEMAYLGMGATLVAALFHGESVVVVNVGDSRAYLLRQGQLRQLSTDHTMVEAQVRRGILTPDEAAAHPQRNRLTRNLGHEPQARPAYATERLQAGDCLLLCSAGVWLTLGRDEMAMLLQAYEGEQAAELLIARAREAGGVDDRSVLLLRVERLPEGGWQAQPIRLPPHTLPPPTRSVAAAEPAPRMESASSKSSQSRWGWLIGLLLLGCMVIGAGSWLLFSPLERPASAPAQQLPPALRLPAEGESVRVGEQVRLEWSGERLPSGAAIEVRVWPEGAEGRALTGQTQANGTFFTPHEAGRYRWTIRVVDQAGRPLGPEAPARTFQAELP